MPTGTIKFYNDEKGYGFITPEWGAGDIFVHVSRLPVSIGMLVKGQRVEFEEGTGKGGKPEARNIRVIGGGCGGMHSPTAARWRDS